MLTKTRESKVIRDVVHGYIHIDLQIIWDLINAKEFQRLRRIKQLGGVFQVYPTAEHSRFAHSLGVYEIVRRMVYEIDDLNTSLNEYEKAVVMMAALLHDIGHLPFSHAFENICEIQHEIFSTQIILENTSIHEILVKAHPALAQDVADVIAYKHANEVLNQILSGQLDADRMDYLLRDAYCTGTSYGNFDLERILRSIRVKNNQIVVKESGIHSVEDYIMARYHMYWQVYFHPVARSFEVILQTIFKRMKKLYQEKPEMFSNLTMFIPFLKGVPNVYDHFMLDEAAVYYGFGLLSKKDDAIVRDLSVRILNRQLFSYTLYDSSTQLNKIIKDVNAHGYDSAYYVSLDRIKENPYRPYESKDGHNIYVLTQTGDVCELSQTSIIVKSLVQGDEKEEQMIFYP